jgi:membrane fusion protein (multidrug efflux system)
MTRLGAPLAIGLALFAGTASAQAPRGPPPAVGTIEVHRQPVVQTSEYIGRIQAIDSVALVARVTGFLDQRLFTEGSEVTKGQLLYVIEQPPFQAQVEANQGTLLQAQANEAYAAAQFERQKNLLNTPAGQKSSYDQTLSTQRADAAAIVNAEANLKTAQINLGYTEVRAPIDGRITATSVNPGNVVSPSSGTLATLVSQDPMYVVFPIAERDIATLQQRYASSGGLAAAKVRVRLSTGKVYDQSGKIDYVAPTVSNSTDTITVRAVVPNPKAVGKDNGATGDRTLVDGQFVTALIDAPQPISLITLPQSAVLIDQQGSYVFTVGADDIAHRTPIHTGEQAGTNISVLSGLDDGATVIVEGLQRVKDGAKVNPGQPAGSPVTGK